MAGACVGRVALVTGVSRGIGAAIAQGRAVVIATDLANPASRRLGWTLNISSVTAKHHTGPPFDAFAQHGGALLFGLTKAALDRFSVGLTEVMVEAALALVSGDPARLTGRGAYSGPLLAEPGITPRGLDGRPL